MEFMKISLCVMSIIFGVYWTVALCSPEANVEYNVDGAMRLARLLATIYCFAVLIFICNCK